MPLTYDTPNTNKLAGIEETVRQTCGFIGSSTCNLEVTPKGVQLRLLAVLVFCNLFMRGLGILHLSGGMFDLLVGCNQVRLL